MVAGTRIDPLRSENRDFDIVGPGWLALAIFSAVVVTHGMLVAALAGRFSQTLRPFSLQSRASLAYALLALLLPVFPALVALGIVGAGTVAFGRADANAPATGIAGWGGPRWLLAGSAVLVVALLIAVPGFVSAAAHIAGRD